MWRKYTTSYPYEKVVRMTETTLSLCVRRVTQGSMQTEETVGTEGRVIRMSDGRDTHFRNGRGGSNLYTKGFRATVPPLRVYFLRF